jgi:hypothetical protein
MAWVLYKKYRTNARVRHIEFAITFEDFVGLTKESCAYCDAAPQLEMYREHSNGAYVYNGLDRVDSTRGYTTDNVVPCCKTCNTRKAKLPVEIFVRRWCFQ